MLLRHLMSTPNPNPPQRPSDADGADAIQNQQAIPEEEQLELPNLVLEQPPREPTMEDHLEALRVIVRDLEAKTGVVVLPTITGPHDTVLRFRFSFHDQAGAVFDLGGDIPLASFTQPAQLPMGPRTVAAVLSTLIIGPLMAKVTEYIEKAKVTIPDAERRQLMQVFSQNRSGEHDAIGDMESDSATS